ncbi:hypothetical protein [Actinoplanes sp. NPDC048796]
MADLPVSGWRTPAAARAVLSPAYPGDEGDNQQRRDREQDEA